VRPRPSRGGKRAVAPLAPWPASGSRRAKPGSARRLAPLTALLRAARVANTVPLAYGRSATRQKREMEVTNLWLAARRSRLRPAAPARRRTPGHLAGAVVAEIRLLRTAAGIGVVQTKRCALSFANLTAAVVANENGLSRHQISLLKRKVVSWRVAERMMKFTRQAVPFEFDTNATSSGVLALRDRGRYRARRQHANVAAGRRSTPAESRAPRSARAFPDR